jgi:creatinine amidohydrolase
MTWTEVKDRLQESDIAIVVVRCTEHHGPHLPLGTDSIEVWRITVRAAMKVADYVKPVIAPLIPYGPNIGFGSWGLPFECQQPGTIHVRLDVIKNLVKDVCRSLIYHGFRKILVMDGCGGHYYALDSAISEVAEETKEKVLLMCIRWHTEFGFDIIKEMTESHKIVHADEAETSIAWAYGADVRVNKLVNIPETPWRFKSLKSPYSTEGYPMARIAFGGRTKPVWESGIPPDSDNTKASKEKGEKIVEAISDRLALLLRELKEKSVEDFDELAS